MKNSESWYSVCKQTLGVNIVVWLSIYRPQVPMLTTSPLGYKDGLSKYCTSIIINPGHVGFILGNIKIYLHFLSFSKIECCNRDHFVNALTSTLKPHWLGSYTKWSLLQSFLREDKDHFSYVVNNTAADDLAMQGASASASMVLNLFCNILVSVSEELKPRAWIILSKL